jgi:hypothetical protein
VSTLNYVSGQTVANAAVISLGDAGAATFIAGVSGAELIIDVNGYYAVQPLVNTLNGLTGDLVLAAGTNIGITPAGNILTHCPQRSLPLSLGGTGSGSATGPEQTWEQQPPVPTRILPRCLLCRRFCQLRRAGPVPTVI